MIITAVLPPKFCDSFSSKRYPNHVSLDNPSCKYEGIIVSDSRHSPLPDYSGPGIMQAWLCDRTAPVQVQESGRPVGALASHESLWSLSDLKWASTLSLSPPD